MPTTRDIEVEKLVIDRHNHRTVSQKNEKRALLAMTLNNENRFWELAESLLTFNYQAVENIVVWDRGDGLIVTEGNRRIGILKFFQGHIVAPEIKIPRNIQTLLDSGGDKWRKTNSRVPCYVCAKSEDEIIKNIKARLHGRQSEGFASRLPWNALGTARHHRDELGGSEPALDLFESYLKHGKNITQEEKDHWAGDYPITILVDAVNRIAKRLDIGSADLAASYPKTKYRDGLEKLMRDVGLKQFAFADVREQKDGHLVFVEKYGFPAPPPVTTHGSGNLPANAAVSPVTPNGGLTTLSVNVPGPASIPPSAPRVKTAPTQDPKSVKRLLRTLQPRGALRSKVVDLRDEMLALKLDDNPIAFCLLLRSILELSAKLYCKDQKSADAPKATHNDGSDRELKPVLDDIYNYLIKDPTARDGKNRELVKRYHPAIAELAEPKNFLSITSMNHLSHHPKMVISARHICMSFHLVFPLLEAMNQ